MEVAERFLKKSKRKLHRKEYAHPHNVPRLNLHVSSNTQAANAILETLLTSVPSERAVHVSTCPVLIGQAVKVEDAVFKGFDPVRKLVSDKRQFMRMYQRVRAFQGVKELTLDDIARLSEAAEAQKVIDVHPNVLKFVHVCSLDPDPYFSCDYNFYYGSCLAVTEHQGQLIVAHPENERLRVMVSDSGNDWEGSHVDELMEKGPIYQVDCSSDLTLLRQKKSCGLFKIDFKDIVSLQKVGVVRTSSVFVNSSLNNFKHDEFVTVSPESCVEVHDVTGKSKRTIDLEIESSKDNWGHTHYHDQNILMFANRDSVVFCDLRVAGAESLLWEVKDQNELCDDVFSAAKGTVMHYICTKHYLLSLDIRKGFVQRWSHGLAGAPSLLNVVPNETHSDALVMGCQSSGLMAFVDSTLFGDFPSNISVPPIRLPSPRETLHLARTKGYLTSPLISSRFSLSLTGLSSFKRSKKIQIFSCNSVGDLFVQYLHPNMETDVPIEPLTASDFQQLQQWESSCLEHYASITHDFKASWVIPFREEASLFNDPVLDEDPPSLHVSNDIQPWKKSKRHLMRCQDALAQKLLTPWDIVNDDEWYDVDEDESIDGDSSDEEDDLEGRVQKWLDRSVNQLPEPNSD